LATLEGGSCTKKIWTVPEAVVEVLCTADDGCGWHPKHVEWTCRIISRLLCVASRWTIINIDQRYTKPWTWNTPIHPTSSVTWTTVSKYLLFVKKRSLPPWEGRSLCCRWWRRRPPDMKRSWDYILYKRSVTADKGRYSSLYVGWGAKIPHLEKLTCDEVFETAFVGIIFSSKYGERRIFH